MTVTSTTTKNQYTGNGSLTTYAYGFKIFATSDLSVYVADVLQTLTTHYTVTNVGVESGGNVVFGTAPATGSNVTIIRSIPYTQATDYTAYDPFPAETHETALDKGVIQSLQLLEKSDRTVRMKPSFAGTEVLVDTPVAGRALKWNAGADGLENSTSDIDAVVAATATSATASATSATASASSATASASSATASASSATAAAASYDSFDDRYLGVKSSDPATDNDSNALVDGALYFNTTNNVMMVYDLGNTTWNRTTPTSADQTKINTVSGIASDVTAVAGKATEIGLLGVAGVITDMGILGTAAIVTDMDLLGTASNVAAMGHLGTAAAVADMAILGTADVVTDMNTLGTADVVADMNTLGTADVVTDMNVLATADVVADMNTLATADIVTDMNLLATSGNVAAMALLGTTDAIADMNTLGTADVVTDLNTLGTADVVVDMNTLGTAGNVTNMNTLAAVSANITTCANNVTSINSFANQYSVAGSAPGSPGAGDLWYDTSLNKLNFYTGSAWTEIAPGITTEVDPNAAALALALG